jgi:hypothetical protein
LKVGRRRELVRQNTVGHEYSAKGGAGGGPMDRRCGEIDVSMTQSLEKVRCAD